MKIKKGTMRVWKRIFGIVLGLAGFGILFGIEFINNILSEYHIVFGIFLLVITYFLVISGRQS